MPDERNLPVVDQLDPAAQMQRLLACRDALQKAALPHGDLRFFTTTLAMQDMDAVREQLGVPQWNLIGASYGTRAALEYLRQFPAKVRRTVIDGIARPTWRCWPPCRPTLRPRSTASSRPTPKAWPQLRTAVAGVVGLAAAQRDGGASHLGKLGASRSTAWL